MKISIITVAYNAATTIQDTIESVLSQKEVDVEYILIDGGSTDGTLDIIEKHKSSIDHFTSEPDRGIYDAMNKGVQAATGDIIGILNSDDIYAHEYVLRDILAKFDSETQGVYADLVYVDQKDTNKVTRTWIAKPYVAGAFKKGWMPPHPTFFVRKEVYEKFGAYSLELRSAADYEFMLRVIHKHQINIGYLPEIIVKMRVGGESNVSLKNRIRANQEDRKAWEMNGLKPGALTLIRKPISKIGQFLKR